MNDPYAAFSKNSQANAVMSPPPVSAVQPSATPAPQQSATDRLEQLLKQLQEEQIVPDTSTASRDSAMKSDTDSSQDFISALASVPAPPTQSSSDFEPPTAVNSLDSVIKTIGNQFVMGQPTLTELLQLAKKSAPSSKSETVAPVPSVTPSPMQFTSPLSDMSQFTAPVYSPPTPTAEPKITVMPPAAPVMPTTSVMPTAPAMPPTPAPSSVPAMSPVPPAESVPASSATESPAPKRRILSQYLTNLAGHLKQHGQLRLPSYTKLVPVR